MIRFKIFSKLLKFFKNRISFRLSLIDKGTFLLLTKRKIGIDEILRNYLYVKDIEVNEGKIVIVLGFHPFLHGN